MRGRALQEVESMKRRKGKGQFIDTRISVDTGGNWKAYTDALPKDCAVIGTVTLGASDTGALVQMAGTRNFLKVNAGQAVMLNQRATTAALKLIENEKPMLEMVSIEEWEQTQPPRIEWENKPQGRTGSVTQSVGVGGLQAAPLTPRRF